MFFSRTEQRIFLPLAATFLLATAILLAVLFVFTGQTIQSGTVKALQRETTLTTRLIETWLHEQRIVFQALARQEPLLMVLGGHASQHIREQALQLLTVVRQERPHFETLFLITPQGEMTLFAGTTRHRSLEPAAMQQQPFFRQAMQGEQVISSAMKNPLTDNPVFLIVTPIRQDNRIVGLVAGAAPTSSCSALFAGGRDPKAPLVVLTDQNTNRLASSFEQSPLLPGLEAFLRTTDKNDLRATLHKNKNQGRNVLTFVQPLQQAQWTVSLSQPMDAGDPVAFFRTNTSLLLAASAPLACIFLFTVLLFRRIVASRLKSLIWMLVRTSAGTEQPVLPAPAPKRADEIDELVSAIHTLIGRQEDSRRCLEDAARTRQTAEQAWNAQRRDLEQRIAQGKDALQQAAGQYNQVADRLSRVEKLEMIGSIAGEVAHDLNNILAGVITYPDLLLLKLPPESPLIQPLKSIQHSGEMAVATIQDLLALARRGALPKELVDLNRVVRQYLRSPEYMLLCRRRPDIEVHVGNIDQRLTLFGSPLHLTKTVSNLISTAAATMPDSGRIYIAVEKRTIDTSLRLYEHIREGCYVVLTVENQGKGIAPSDLRRIFDPFYTKKIMHLGGTGLELPVVRATVRDHDGFLDCANIPGTGIRFTLFFPASAPYGIGEPPPSNPSSARI
ncbi:MAG: sensor histidine kinase [Desulfobulbus sp.]|jgi:two-component system cell cycle sensor histidine kinase/response regulator CckA